MYRGIQRAATGVHRFWKRVGYWIAVGVFLVAQPGPAATEEVHPTDYRALDDKALGHLRHLVAIATQPLEQAGGTSPLGSFREGVTDASFSLVVLAYTLGLTHYHYTPAYREIYQNAMDQVIQKLLFRGISAKRADTSGTAGERNASPRVLGEPAVTPLAREDVTYCGHLFAAVGTYTMLFRDRKYMEQGALPFDYKTVFPGVEAPETDKQDFSTLAKFVYERYAQSPMGFVCEPNAIFLFCNVYPFYGFRFHDHVVGTDYLSAVTERFRNAWKRKGGVTNREGHFVETFLIAQDFIWVQPTAFFDAWAGTWMTAWNRDDIRSLYPGHAKQWVKWLPDGTAYVEARPDLQWTRDPPSDFGHFAVYASERGDRRTVEALLAYAEKHMNPCWEEGAYSFPPCDTLGSETDPPVILTPLAGSVLLALARINVPDGVFATFHEPFTKKHFEEPYIDKVDYPAVLVRRAVYDEAKRGLIVCLAPGREPVKTTFRVNRLGANEAWAISKNGATLGWVRRGTLQDHSGPDIRLRMEDRETLSVTLELREDVSFVVEAVKETQKE